MAEIQGKCSHDDARLLDAKGTVVAKVHGRPVIVSAGAWEPAIGQQNTPHYVTARLIEDMANDVEAKGTPKADEETQELIDGMAWEQWPE